VLTETYRASRLLEEILWRAQIEERCSGIENGFTISQLHIIKEALEKIKSDYLQLFMDRDLVLKFIEDKEREVEELHYQLILARSSPPIADISSGSTARK
jgi:hypothetical protein